MTSGSIEEFSSNHDGAPASTFAVFDIDGVLADVRHRLHHVERSPKNWEGFFAGMGDDAPLEIGVAMVHEQVAAGYDIAYLTGRNESYREVTQTWLANQGLPAGRLIMRRDNDRRPAKLYKPEALSRLARHGAIEIVVDDDAAVIDALLANGWPVFHATWMLANKDEQQSLFDAQEVDGRN
jgi:phosphoglycolate phosphatase-like HAD superfamily hydrolase